MADDIKECWICQNHFQGETCPKCDLDEWKSQRTAGWLTLLALWPLYLAGAFAGFFYSALRAGFSDGSGVWGTARTFIRRPKPSVTTVSRKG